MTWPVEKQREVVRDYLLSPAVPATVFAERHGIGTNTVFAILKRHHVNGIRRHWLHRAKAEKALALGCDPDKRIPANAYKRLQRTIEER